MKNQIKELNDSLKIANNELEKSYNLLDKIKTLKFTFAHAHEKGE